VSDGCLLISMMSISIQVKIGLTRRDRETPRPVSFPC
jgi:hypothetical protein